MLTYIENFIFLWIWVKIYNVSKETLGEELLLNNILKYGSFYEEVYMRGEVWWNRIDVIKINTMFSKTLFGAKVKEYLYFMRELYFWNKKLV